MSANGAEGISISMKQYDYFFHRSVSCLTVQSRNYLAFIESEVCLNN